MNHARALCLTLLLALTLAAPAAAAAGAQKGAPGAGSGGAPAVRPVDPPAHVLDELLGKERERPAPKQAPAKIEAEGETLGAQSIGAASEPFWSWGVTKYQSGLNCSIVGSPYYETQVTSQVGYGGTPTVPRVGERFNVVLLYSHPGYACSGGFLADLYTELNLPDGAQLAIDATHGIGCFTTTRANPNTWVNVTNSTWSSPNGTSGTWCKTDGATGMRGGINLGFRMMVTGTMFQIVVPVVATKELKGAAHTPTVAEFRGTTESVVTTSRLAYPSVWANVLGFAQAPSIAYPTPSATQITATGAKTTSYVYNRYRTGNAYVDLGTTTAYGTSSNPIPLGANEAYTINATWNTLRPGRVYHWRARFVDANGTVTLGPDQVFKTAPGSVVARSGGSISLRAYGNARDDVRISLVDGRYRFFNPTGLLVPGAGCLAVTANEVTCDGTGVTGLTADAGTYDDAISVDPGVTVPVTLAGGQGNDRLTGGSGADSLDGGPGADVMIGGRGGDTAVYAARTASQPVTVTLDDVANDGGAIDVSGVLKDHVRGDVERITGGLGADTLVGNSGNNFLRGGGGADKLTGGGDSDRIEARDDVVDLAIDCGSGTDRAIVDATPVDPTAVGCEAVEKG